jgi:hypothetical protein
MIGFFCSWKLYPQGFDRMVILNVRIPGQRYRFDDTAAVSKFQSHRPTIDPIRHVRS